MRDLMPTNPDDSPVSFGLREVFHLGPSADVTCDRGPSTTPPLPDRGTPTPGHR
jgi:hypothetical protein